MYPARLLVIYGLFGDDHSLTSLYRKTFTLLETVLATLVLTAAVVLLAKFWGWLKQRSLPTARGVSYAAGFIVLILFFVRGS
jgi:FtsH-binding integral membrane protein